MGETGIWHSRRLNSEAVIKVNQSRLFLEDSLFCSNGLSEPFARSAILGRSHMAKAEGRENLYGSFVAKNIEKTQYMCIEALWWPCVCWFWAAFGISLRCGTVGLQMLYFSLQSSAFLTCLLCERNCSGGKVETWSGSQDRTDKICEHSTWAFHAVQSAS